MTMTDPIADMLTRLRNANQAYHDDVAMPYSKLKAGVAEILQQEGYIGSWRVEEPEAGAVGRSLVLSLKYGPSRERSLAGVRGSASRDCGSTPSRPTCRECSAGSASRSSRPRRACSPTVRPTTRV